MEDKERQSAFLSALNTEYFVLQSASSATVNESAARASIYIMALSSFLVATGFVSRSPEAFGPLVASVLPALFLLGLFTVIRLVDINGQYMQQVAAMARIRSYYSGLTPEAADYFAPDRKRSPEESIPALQLGRGIAFLTTTSAMVAVINNIVAGTALEVASRSRAHSSRRSARRGRRPHPHRRLPRISEMAIRNVRADPATGPAAGTDRKGKRQRTLAPDGHYGGERQDPRTLRALLACAAGAKRDSVEAVWYSSAPVVSSRERLEGEARMSA